MSEDQFMRQADTGDLLLFRTNYFMAHATRLYSNSHFDHVGMILKDRNNKNEVYILDATSSGVSTVSWTMLRYNIGADNFYEKVVFKKVNFERTPQVIQKMDKFIG